MKRRQIAWILILIGNTIALVSAMTYDWIVNAIGCSSSPNTLASLSCGALSRLQLHSSQRHGQFDRRADTFRPRQRRPHA